MKSIISRGKSVIALTGMLFLGACSGSVDTDLSSVFGKAPPPPPCPQVAVLPNADIITIFQDGPGRDLVDVLFEGVIAPVGGECVYEDDNSLVAVELILRLGSVKGPAARTQRQDFSFFVAIADKSNRVLNKKVFLSPIQIPEGRRRAAVHEEIVQRIPLPSGRHGGDYKVIVGFQLTAEELNYNRKTTN